MITRQVEPPGTIAYGQRNLAVEVLREGLCLVAPERRSAGCREVS